LKSVSNLGANEATGTTVTVSSYGIKPA